MRFTIVRKIALPFVLILTLMISEGAVAILELNKASESIARMTHETLKQRNADELKSDVASLLMAVNDFVITGNRKYQREYDTLSTKVNTRIGDLKRSSLNTSEWRHVGTIERNLDSVRSLAGEIFKSKKARENPEATALMERMDYRYGNRIYTGATLIMDSVECEANILAASVDRGSVNAFRTISGLSIAALLIAVAIVSLTIRRISKPILELVRIAERIAARDFSANLAARTQDEIGMLIVAFNAMSLEIRRRYEELENFSYIVAHDLKAPLTGVIGMAEILFNDFSEKIEDQGKEFLRDIVASGHRMSALIGDLLEFARAGKVEFSKDPIPMDNILAEVQQDLAFLLMSRNVSLVIPDTLPACFCDPIRLSLVWRNLISNAIKYNDKPSPVIEVAVREDKSNSAMYCFSLKDNGIGIEQSQLSRIFMPFQRAVKGSQYEGTGIGLAIVKRVVEYHGGRVWAESKLNEGTTFFFTIPKPHKTPGKSTEGL